MKRIRLASIVFAVAALAALALAASASATVFAPSFSFGSPGFGESQFRNPSGIAIDSTGNVWISDSEQSKVKKFNSKGVFQSQFSASGGAQDVAIDSKGNLWVPRWSGETVTEYNTAGAEIGHFGEFGEAAGKFVHPAAMTIDSKGNFWVIDNPFHQRIQEFNSAGKYVTGFNLPFGEGKGQFYFAEGVVTDSANNLWITDYHESLSRVLKFNSKGEYLSQVGEGYLSDPLGSARFDSAGNLWIGDSGDQRVKEFSSSGSPASPINEFGESFGEGAGAFASPADLAFDSSGGIFVADTGYDRIDRWAPSTPSTQSLLAEMAVTEPFDGGTTSKANYAANWSKLGWAFEKGNDTTTGWRGIGPFPLVNGAFFNSTITDTGMGTATVGTMAESPANNERYFSAWLDASGSSSTPEGYELRFTQSGTNVYNVTLSRWTGGKQTVLASQAGYGFAIGSSFALVDQGSTVSAWTKTGSEFAQLLSASDATFASGNAGIDASGNLTKLINFKTGVL